MLKSLFCRHEWKVAITSKVPSRLVHVRLFEDYVRLSCGFTQTVLTCTKCGKIKTVELLGDAKIS